MWDTGGGGIWGRIEGVGGRGWGWTGLLRGGGRDIKIKGTGKIGEKG